MPRGNPLPSFHAKDNAPYVELIKRVCGCADRTANQIVAAYLDGYGIETASKADFRRHGATDKQAERLHAAFDLARFAARSRLGWRQQIKTPQDVEGYLRANLPHLEEESFVAILLDSRQRVIDAKVVAMGSLSQVDVHPRELFRDAVRLRAHSMILAHNHPSSDASPSEADVQLTKRMSEAGRLVGIPVLDHLVVGGDEATSLAALGLMPAAADTGRRGR